MRIHLIKQEADIMQHHILRAIAIAINLLILTTAHSRPVFAQPVSTDELFSAATAGQRKLKEFEDESRSYTCETTHTQNGKGSSVKFRVQSQGDSRLVKFRDSLICLHHGCMFAIQKASNELWQLKKYTRNIDRKSWLENTREFRDFLYPYQTNGLPFSVNRTDGLRKDFQTISTSVISQNRLRLDYTFVTNAGKPATGYLIFATDLDYLVVSESVVAENNAGQVTKTIRTRIGERVNGHVVINKITWKVQAHESNTDIAVYEAVLNYDSPAAVNEAEFTLEHYGITPPADDVFEDRGFNWPLWGSLGVIAMVFSVLLRWYLRRRSRLNTEG